MNTDLISIKKANTRNNLIFIADVVLFFILLNTLPFTPEANKSLALLVFIAILWLTEALHVTVTALLVPILGILLGLVKSKEALAAFADPTIFLFFGGFAFGTVGLKALFSKDAKKCYTHVTAAALRVKDYTLKRTETLKENCEDIYEDAKDINEDRKAAEEAVFEDTSKSYKEVESSEE